MDERTDRQTEGRTDGWMDEQTKGRTDELTDGRTNGRKKRRHDVTTKMVTLYNISGRSVDERRWKTMRQPRRQPFSPADLDGDRPILTETGRPPTESHEFCGTEPFHRRALARPPSVRAYRAGPISHSRPCVHHRRPPDRRPHAFIHARHPSVHRPSARSTKSGFLR